MSPPSRRQSGTGGSNASVRPDQATNASRGVRGTSGAAPERDVESEGSSLAGGYRERSGDLPRPPRLAATPKAQGRFDRSPGVPGECFVRVAVRIRLGLGGVGPVVAAEAAAMRRQVRKEVFERGLGAIAASWRRVTRLRL
jgi:hypothetical protein